MSEDFPSCLLQSPLPNTNSGEQNAKYKGHAAAAAREFSFLMEKKHFASVYEKIKYYIQHCTNVKLSFLFFLKIKINPHCFTSTKTLQTRACSVFYCAHNLIKCTISTLDFCGGLQFTKIVFYYLDFFFVMHGVFLNSRVLG